MPGVSQGEGEAMTEHLSTSFRSKPTTIEAIHWDGENFWDPVKWGEGKVRFYPRAGDDHPEGLTLLAGKDGAQEWVPVPVGHWLVCQPDDKSDIWPVEATYFAAKYEPLVPGLAEAEQAFLDASVAVWRRIDAVGLQMAKAPTDEDVELRHVERAAWNAYRDLLPQDHREGE
jgi:hypothetical protein